jgi:hypothetical protein
VALSLCPSFKRTGTISTGRLALALTLALPTVSILPFKSFHFRTDQDAACWPGIGTARREMITTWVI